MDGVQGFPGNHQGIFLSLGPLFILCEGQKERPLGTLVDGALLHHERALICYNVLMSSGLVILFGLFLWYRQVTW